MESFQTKVITLTNKSNINSNFYNGKKYKLNSHGNQVGLRQVDGRQIMIVAGWQHCSNVSAAFYFLLKISITKILLLLWLLKVSFIEICSNECVYCSRNVLWKVKLICVPIDKIYYSDSPD